MVPRRLAVVSLDADFRRPGRGRGCRAGLGVPGGGQLQANARLVQSAAGHAVRWSGQGLV